MTWTSRELAVLGKLSTPEKVQRFIDRFEYRPEEPGECPRVVLRERRSHCYDGALFTAAVLSLHGYRPLVMDLWADRDDDHVVFVYKYRGHYGSVSRSDWPPLRSREPIYRTVRELALSYFDHYFSIDRRRSLRFYSTLCDLSRFDKLDWRFDSRHMQRISDHLDSLKHRPLLPRGFDARRLAPVDPWSMAYAMLARPRQG